MKKIISTISAFSLVLLLFISPIQASAATADSKLGIVATSSSRLIVRKSASASSALVTSLPKGGYITLISKTGNWWYVEYAKNSYGYCSADYISITNKTPSYVNLGSGSLNVRNGAGTGYSIIGSLKKGETVFVISSSGSWSRIVYNGTLTGYVNNSYLSAYSGYRKISLSVPNYKQTDSRWASVQVGSSGKTISQIGCATTAISMMESYRTGQALTPNIMVSRLKYTSSGNVYWPSNYTVITNSSGYLTKIYNQLSYGKPVLLGAKNSAGKQHWVVITGYNGASSITASGFTINDPGSSTRVTLSQFLSEYPTLYKYFYY